MVFFNAIQIPSLTLSPCRLCFQTLLHESLGFISPPGDLLPQTDDSRRGDKPELLQGQGNETELLRE